MSEVLVVYYSRTGKTRYLAERLAEMLGAACEAITEEKDRSGALGFVAAGMDTIRKKPTELTHSPEPEDHAVIVLGMPVWASRPPPAVNEWLGRVDLTGKTVCLFATSDGGSARGAFSRTNELLPKPAAETRRWVRPKQDDEELETSLRDWAEKIRAHLPPSA